MSNNINVLLVGAGNMAKEYHKVLKAQNSNPIVVGRGEKSAKEFYEATGTPVLLEGLDKVFSGLEQIPSHGIVAVSVEELKNATISLINYGVKNILVEKPAGLNENEIKEIYQTAELHQAKVFVAYNRRFYESVEKAMEIIKSDGGVTSFNFEFTEWSHVIQKLQKAPGVKEAWFLGNSTHVVDLAFFLGGKPLEFNSFIKGSLDWHPNGSIYAGAGISQKDALFSYQANWEAPGRWGIEVMTKNHRLYFRPVEKLHIQQIGSISIDEVEINYNYDLNFKPGVYKMVEAFLLNKSDERKITIEEQLENMKFYNQINGVKCDR